MITIKKRVAFAILTGNILEHYDRALYVLIAPFIAHLFYPHFHPLTALMIAYLPISFIFRPLGALFFGYFGDRWGRKRALHLSIIGMSIVILLIGLVPTYQTIGIFSAVLLHFLRGMVCFFAAGEGTAASLTLIDQSPEKYKNLFSSIYEMSSMGGVFIASALISLLTFQDLIYDYWRALFILSGLLGLVCFFARLSLFGYEVPQKKIEPLSIKKNFLPFISIVFVCGFSYANYAVLSSLMNGLIPLITPYTKAQMMSLHTYLIIYDFLMLPVFGYLAQRFGKEKMIFLALFSSLVLIIPLFLLLKSPSLWLIFLIRLAMVTWGIALAACYDYWMMSVVEPSSRFRVIAMGRAIGAKWLGAPAISVSLYLYQKTEWVGAPALYVLMTAALALGSLVLLYRGRLIQISFKSKPEPAAESA